MSRRAASFAFAVMSAAVGIAANASSAVVTFKPSFVPPAALTEMLGVRPVDGSGVLEWKDGGGAHAVQVRRYDAANLIAFSGDEADVSAAEALARSLDVAPRQVSIEARIIEVDKTKARNLGIDWDQLIQNSGANLFWGWDEQRTTPVFAPPRITRRSLSARATADLSHSLRLLDENGALTTRDAPRIVTLNNHGASILDGQRVTYIVRYSSFTNLFVTDSLDAGLKLSVLPSLGESGYLTLGIRAELTTLSSNISGSPVKDGQMVENTVIVKDGETVMLGGFQREMVQTTRRRFPLLGYVLPFLFSREIHNHTTMQSYVLLTPRVVDLNPASGPEGPARQK